MPFVNNNNINDNDNNNNKQEGYNDHVSLHLDTFAQSSVFVTYNLVMTTC